MKALIQRRVGREASIDRAAATSRCSHGARSGQLGGMR